MTEAPSPSEGPDSATPGFFLPVLILVAAFLVSALDSQSFPLLNILWVSVLQRFVQSGPGHPFPEYLPPLIQFASVLVAVGVFYLIGLRADFRRYRVLAGLSFAGAFAANAVGYLVASADYGGGTSLWSTGFGFVQSLGLPEPSGFLDVLSAAVGTFLLPVAGFVVGQGRRDGRITLEESAVPSEQERGSIRPFAVAGFLLVAAAPPVGTLVYRYLTTSSPSVVSTEGFRFWPSLASGYIGFLVYPVLLILTFFFLGRNSGLRKVSPRNFVGPVVAASIAGLMVGFVLNLYPTYASGYPAYTLSTMAELSLAAVVGGISVFFLGLASASLGVLGRPEAESRPATWARRGYGPVLLAVLTVALVSLATVAAVSYGSATPSYSCVYQPGNALYLKVVSDQGGAPIAGLGASGELVSLCPVVFSCTGSCNTLFQTSTITKLGEWDFVTNASGYLTVSSPMLGGSAFWFTLTSAGHTYLAKYQVCGGGVTIGQLSLPSGATSGMEIPGNSENVVSSGIGPNGTEFISGCGGNTFSGNATMS